jgi:thiol-disulfide isomerase/thioredoxin
MKKFLIILVIGSFILSGIGASAVQSYNIKPVLKVATNQEPLASSSPRDYTHTVLVEVGTATWCPSCPASNSAWHSIYSGGNYDFEYTELVYDMNSAANARFMQFNPMWVPTSYWDGGEFVYPGTSIPTFYNYLDSSGSRVVPDLVADLDAIWLGSAKLEISYSVVNNEGSNYPGRLRIYVIEFESTLWDDNSGKPYHHAFLDFATNKAIDIPAADSISDTIVWNGAVAGYPDITIDNIQVILAVFDDTAHQSYSDPPTGNPFWAYYSDECVAEIPVINNPPGVPTITGPNSGKPATSYDFKFNAVDPDGNQVKYIINWGDGNSDTTALNPSGTDVTIAHTWSVQGTYTIKVKVEDEHGLVGPEATFTVTITKDKNKAINTPFLNFLEEHQNLFQILQKIIQRLELQY